MAVLGHLMKMIFYCYIKIPFLKPGLHTYRPQGGPSWALVQGPGNSVHGPANLTHYLSPLSNLISSFPSTRPGSPTFTSILPHIFKPFFLPPGPPEANPFPFRPPPPRKFESSEKPGDEDDEEDELPHDCKKICAFQKPQSLR